ncbi:hypothetical protein MmiEs2_10850 [Methanimicrococcus stummii]|uniref:Uncharacterized protein n=1 Tax=Methanimicrococcus stummii TaxID=3028294 RepID=A0AA96V8U4_9EURY|nr:hypothetical protein [Methanimicrococcus sp. Es2]WNY28872.1 hypothetical protein MmiEs2_10850 [Methanimicrococcus sp. Es2]
MKKNILVAFLLLAVVFAVGVSGCLGGDDADNATNNTNTTDNTTGNNTGNTSNETDNSSNESVQKPVPPFDANLTLVHPVPEEFVFFSTATVKSHGQHIGVTDALYGYQGIYHYGSAGTPVFLTYYDVAIANTTKTPDSYIQMMKDSHSKTYGSDSNITTIQFNGHDATLFAAETDEAPQYGKYMVAWALGDSMFVTVTGTVGDDALITLATATGY